jgi:AbrB family looped-hinge helix DNA binding protein
MGVMDVAVDKAGRMVLPKPVRERLGLVRGGKLHLQESAEGVVLKPAENRTSLVRRPNGRLMITGLRASGVDWDRLVDDMREERIREIAGR